MSLSSPRTVTYSAISAFALIAIGATPKLQPASRSPAITALETRSVASRSDPVSLVQPVSDLPSAAGYAVEMAPAIVLPAGGVPFDPVVVTASGAERIDTLALSGVIRSNLYSALDQSSAGTLPRSARAALAWSIADIFEYRVDMSRDLHKGDRFQVLVERLQKPNGAIIINRVLGARLALSGREIEAIHFRSAGSSGEYFDEGGKSLRAAFLRTPVSFRRISSLFGRRRHPILGRWRSHKGMDYAAASGTPVRTIGDGVVIFAGRRSGYGNVIDVRHRNGYVSRYGHLRGFARGIRRGAHVSIGSTIGYVGMTGLATGPHLHFEVLVRGVQRDPRIALNNRGGDPIRASERSSFERMRTRTLSSLNGAMLASATP